MMGNLSDAEIREPLTQSPAQGAEEETTAPSRAERTLSVSPFAGYEAWYQLSQTLAADRNFQPRRKVSLAVLATFTMEMLFPLIEVAAARHSLGVELIATPFGQIEQILLSESNGFREIPEYLVLVGTWYDLGLVSGSSVEDAEREAVARWTGLWDAAIAMGARVVQIGFVPPTYDSYGLAAHGVQSSISAAVARINSELAKCAASRVLFVDAASAAAVVGLRNWNSSRYWHSMRLPCSPDALPHLASLIAGVLAEDCGLTARCVITDLDNTLWGGILGEEGVDGIVVGNGSQGEAYLCFQQYLRGLRQRGVALAIASKNDPGLVEEVLERNTRMALRRDDFACIVAGWQPKSEQILEIAQRLRLGLSSLLFLDDNPAERAEVAHALPEVQVVDMPRSPAAYIEAVASAPGLFAAQYSQQDGLRGDSYAGLRQAAEGAAKAASLDEFLHGLKMRAEIQPLTATALPRAAQMVAKTNQFNLTTRRRTQTELEKLMHTPSVLALTLSLRDCYADHGMVGLCLVFVEGKEAWIDTLLLSCRVIGRTAERALMAAAARWAAEQGCATLLGLYIPTERNQLVAGLYPELGFTGRDEPLGDAEVFGLDLLSSLPQGSNFIEVLD